MEIIIKIVIVLSFVCLGIYRSRFLWPDLEAFYGTKCRQLSWQKTRLYENTVHTVQYSVGIIVLISFILNPLHLVSFLVGFFIFISGLLFARSARITLGKSWAHIFEVTTEKQPLVRTGAYRWCRNPIYVSLFIEWIGFVITFGWNLLTEPYFLLILLIGGWYLANKYHEAVLLEEKILAKRYGNDYKNYKIMTPRYLPLGPILQKMHIKPIL